MDKIYARVVNGVITEFPVFEHHINSRNHPLNWYTLCKSTIRPKVTEFQSITSEPHVVNDEVIIEYKVHDNDLQFLLTKAGMVDPKNPTGITPKPIAEINPNLVTQIRKKATEHAQIAIDNFAKERGYYDANSAVSYEFSTVEKFANEANKVKVARDQLWLKLHAYVAEIMKGNIPFPTKVSEIEAVFPVMKWE